MPQIIQGTSRLLTKIAPEKANKKAGDAVADDEV